jgi:hypothetical protein
MNPSKSKNPARRFRTVMMGIVFPALLLVTIVCSGQTPRPPANYRDNGACPFECCTYRRWSVDADTIIYQDQSEKSGVAFRVKKGEHVVGLTGVVITLKPGKAIVRKATTIGQDKRKIRVKPGDVLYLLHYMGEGFYKIWFNGRIYENEMPTAPDEVGKPAAGRKQESIEVQSEPDTVWWVKVRNRRNQVGWSKQTRNFGNMDACG